MFLKIIPAGAGGRWAIGAAILIHLTTYNESGGPTALIATIFAAICSIFIAFNKSNLSHVQMPYVRATQKSDFFCLFLALWMDILTLLTACAALARTLSTCLDAMTGGMARIYLLGRNSPENEPWPDVLGVSVVFLLTVMFMLGLENTRIFSLLMSTGVVGMMLIIFTLSLVRGRLDVWQNGDIFPKGLLGVLSCSAICTFAFPSELITIGNYRRLKGLAVIFIVCLLIVIAAACLSTITQFNENHPFIAVPLFSIIDKQDFHKVEPAIACLLVLACSGAYLELFPEMYSLIVKLTTAEYKILAKQIGYENNDSGSPILAIFIGGSLCAMLAFACPLENLIYILSASHLAAGILRSFYLLYSPFKPKYMESSSSSDATLAYSRLDVNAKPGTSTRRSIWCFNKPKTISISTSKSRLKKKSKHDEELEREWLLLGEPQSPRVTVTEPDAESSILSDQPASDIECIDRQIITESESSTDIDAIVDEYRQKIKISTAGPMEKIIRIPTIGSWRVSLCLVLFIVVGLLMALFGTIFNLLELFICGIIGSILFSCAMQFLPSHAMHSTSPSALICGIGLTIETVLLASTLANSWPLVVFWIFAGFTLYMRCDKWCCQCFDRPRSQRLIANVTPNIASIRIPCPPPRGSIIQSRISGHR